MTGSMVSSSLGPIKGREFLDLFVKKGITPWSMVVDEFIGA